MAKYETMIILSTSSGEEATKALLEKFTTLIGKNGEILSVDEWGKQKLAYEINDEKEAYYTLVTFNSKEDFPAELDRVFGITEGVLRTMTIAKNV